MPTLLRLRRLFRCVRGQDVVEYALLAGFLAVTAGAALPGIQDDLDSIYRSLSKTVHGAATSSRGSGQPPTRL